MSKLFRSLVLLICISSSLAFSMEGPETSPDFTYTAQKHPSIISDVTDLITSYDNFFTERELKPISVPELIHGEKTSLESLNRIYSGHQGRTVVFIKAGVIPGQVDLFDKTVRIGEGYLSHIKQFNGLVVAVFVKSDNWEIASEIVKDLRSRATAAHIKAITNGLDKNSVRKVWALGDLKTGSSNWRYHVTTIVRDTKGKWHAIDPIMGKVMPVEQWYKAMKKFDVKGDMRIFHTEAKRFGPLHAEKYSRGELNAGHYEGYFEDLMTTFRKESSELAAQRRLLKQ